MKRRSGLANGLILTAILTGAVPVNAGDEFDLTGTWKLRTSFGGRGERISILQFGMTQGGGVSGSMISRQGDQIPLHKIQFADGELAFEMTRKWGNRSFTIPYAGKVVGDTLRGTADFQFRGTPRTLQWTANRTTRQELSEDWREPPVAADIELNDENYAPWRNHILPASAEMSWSEIGWLTTFKDGILQANAADKPLLFWTMNGHPLGCT